MPSPAPRRLRARAATPPALGRPPRISRTAILDAAEHLGLTTFTVAGLARHLGVSEGALYRHVQGTAEIRMAASSRILARLDTGAPADLGWAAYLEHVCAQLRTLAMAHDGFGRWVLAGDHDEDALAVFDAIVTELVARRAGLDRDTAYLLGANAVACTVGLVVSGFVAATPGEPTEADFDAQFRWMLRSLLRGMELHLTEGVAPPRVRALDPPRR